MIEEQEKEKIIKRKKIAQIKQDNEKIQKSSRSEDNDMSIV